MDWFDRRPGEGLIAQDDPHVILLGDQTPDVVRLPPELGRGELRVTGAFRGACPMNEGCPDCQHLRLEEGYSVAECIGHGFIWYRRGEK